jgi:hypothetical protein
MPVPGWPLKAAPPANIDEMIDWFDTRVRWWREAFEAGRPSPEFLDEVKREVRADGADKNPERFTYWYMRDVVDGVRRWNDHQSIPYQPIWVELGQESDQRFFPHFDAHLSAVLGVLRGHAKAHVDGPWSEPDTPAGWSKRFKMSWDALKPRLQDGTIRNKKLSSKSYQIHIEDVPKT